MLVRLLRLLIALLLAFLSLTSLAGGFALATEIIPMPPGLLYGSPFADYLVPGLALFSIVGGGSLAALLLFLRGSRWGHFLALLSGLAIIVFEAVEIITIGSEPGLERNLQALYLGVGAALILFSILLGVATRRARPRSLFR